MYFLVYSSVAVHAFSPVALRDLLTQYRAANLRFGITGMLLYKEGNFMQVLEGDESAVRALYANITRDPLHRGLIRLIHGTRAERHFPEWSMGFHDLNDAEVRSMPGYSAFLTTPLTSVEFAVDPTRCQKLLLMFKRTM